MSVSIASRKVTGFIWSIVLFAILLAAAQTNALKVSTEWANQIGGNGSNESGGITHDAHGNAYVTGIISGSVNFDPGGSNFTLSGSAGFVCKYDPDGNFVWAKRIGEKGYNSGRALKADAFGNIYITGSMGDVETRFDPGAQLVEPRGMYILKLDTAGNFIWVKNMGPAGSIIPNAINVDGYGNVYTTGEFGGSLDMNPSGKPAYINSASNNDVFVTKVDSSGNLAWAKGFGGEKVDRGYSIAVDDLGNVYTTGAFRETADFDPDPNQEFKITASTSNSQAFISKLDSTGNFVWAKTFAGQGEGDGIRIDACGYVYSTGFFHNTVDFDPDSLSSEVLTGSYAMYISKLDADGQFVWVKSIGRSMFPFSMEMDHQANLYITGRYSASRVNFNPGPGPSDTFYLSSVKYDDAFMLKLTNEGQFSWAASFGSDVADAGRGLSIDQDNNVYATGIFQKELIYDTAFNQFPLKASDGGYDIYVFKIDQACSDTSLSMLEVKVCGDQYELNCHDYTESGVYTQIFQNAQGCDSTVTLVLSIGNIVKPVITVQGFELGTDLSYSTYQWFVDGDIMEGETDSILHVTKNGNYYVVVSNEYGCVDTSEVYEVTNVSSISPEKYAQSIEVYPNPAKDQVYIRAAAPVNVVITNIAGKELRTIEDATTFSLSDLAGGIYLLRIFNTSGNLLKVEKLVRE